MALNNDMSAMLIDPGRLDLRLSLYPFVNREGRLLLLGFGLSTTLFVGVLGVRFPVLLSGSLPPLGALALWYKLHPQRRRLSPSPQPSLLEASVLRQRLQIEGELNMEALDQWRWIAERLEAVRILAVQCTDLDGGCSVPLLVLLERLVDKARLVADDLQHFSEGSRARDLGRLGRRSKALQEELQVCLDDLGRCYDIALEDAMRCPDVPRTVLITPTLLEI